MIKTGQVSNRSLYAGGDVRNHIGKRTYSSVHQYHGFAFGKPEDIFFVHSSPHQHEPINQAQKPVCRLNFHPW